MKKLILVLTLLVAPAASAQTAPTAPQVPQVQQPSADETKAVRVLLSAIHELPSRPEFERAADDPYVILSRLAKGSGPIADRALEAMFLWPNEQTFTTAVSALTADATPTARKHSLLMLLGRAYPEQATPVVTEFLASDDVQLRITAAAAVAEMRTEAAFTALDAALAVEQNASAKKVMQRYARRVVR